MSATQVEPGLAREHAAGTGVRRTFDLALITLFLVALASPTLDACLRSVDERTAAHHEMRSVLEFPPTPRTTAALARFPTYVEGWFKDRMGLRDQLLRLRAHVRGLGFGVSPIEEADLAPEAWTFLRGDASREAWAGALTFTQNDLEAWEAALRSRADACRALGAQHLFLLGPNKETIYSERVPKTWHKFGPTRFEQLLAWLRERQTVEIVDLRPALWTAKAQDQPDEREFLYFPLGTHWTPRGDYVAYEVFHGRLKQLFPALSPPTLYSELLRQPFSGEGDSWAYRAFLEDVYTQPVYIMLPPKPAYYPAGVYGDGRRMIVALGPDTHAPRGILFHDSFGTNVSGLLAPHFSRLHCCWTSQLDLELIRREKPDVVMELYVERMMANTDPRTMHVTLPSDDALQRELERAPVFVLKREHFPEIVAGAGLSLRLAAESSGILRLRLERDGGYVVLPRLPEFQEPNGAGCVVNIEIIAADETDLALLPMRTGEDTPRRVHPGSAHLVSGWNAVRVRMPYIPNLERFALRPGRVPGRYVIVSFEVRPAEWDAR